MNVNSLIKGVTLPLIPPRRIVHPRLLPAVVAASAAMLLQSKTVRADYFWGTGNGNWDYSTPNWVGDGSVFTAGGNADFNNVSATVTVSGNVSAGAMTVQDGGNQSGSHTFAINGGSLSLSSLSMNGQGLGGNIDSLGDALGQAVQLSPSSLTVSGNVGVGRGSLQFGNTTANISGEIVSTSDWSDLQILPGANVTTTGVDMTANGVVASNATFGGGTLYTGFISGNEFAGATSVNFDGTTIIATRNNSDFLNVAADGTHSPHSQAAYLGTAGGLVFNPNGFAVTIVNQLVDFPGQSGKVTVTGGGTLTLFNYNTYSAGTIIGNGSTLILDNVHDVGSGIVTIQGGGVLQLQATSANTNSSAVCSAMTGSNLAIADGGTLQLRSDSSVTFDGTNNTVGNATFNYDVDSLTGSTTGQTLTVGSIVATYNNTVNVTGGHGYSLNMGDMPQGYYGPLTYNTISANLILGNIGAAGPTGQLTFNSAGGTISVTGNVNSAGLIVVNATANASIAGSVACTSLEKDGTGRLILSGSNTFGGALGINSGTVTLGNTSAAGTATIYLQSASSTLELATDTAFGTGGSPAYNLQVQGPSGGPAFSGTLALGRATAGASNSITHNFGLLTLSESNVPGQLNLVKGQNATSALDNASFSGLSYGNWYSIAETLNPTGGNFIIGTVAPQPLGVSGPAVATLILDGTTAGNQITGVISDTNNGNQSSAAIVKSNSSTWTLSGSNTYSGGTTVNAGLLVAASGLSALGTGPVTLNGGGIILRNTSAGSVFPLLHSGYNGGAWNGSGISSAAAAADSNYLHAIGELQPASSNTFEGQSLGTGDVALKYTYYGDANLDGAVNSADYTAIDNGFLQKLTGWQNGDFNYDGVVNGSDYTLIDNAFNRQGAVIASEIATANAQLAGTGTTSAVPEPASLGMAGMVASLLLARRRRVGK